MSSPSVKKIDDWRNMTILQLQDWMFQLILHPGLTDSTTYSDYFMIIKERVELGNVALPWNTLFIWYILIKGDSLLCNSFISTSCPIVLILFDLILSSSISLNLSIITTTCFIFDQEDILSNMSRLVVLDEVRLVFKECFTSGCS